MAKKKFTPRPKYCRRCGTVLGRTISPESSPSSYNEQTGEPRYTLYVQCVQPGIDINGGHTFYTTTLNRQQAASVRYDIEVEGS